jgi:hypothetical protein
MCVSYILPLCEVDQFDSFQFKLEIEKNGKGKKIQSMAGRNLTHYSLFPISKEAFYFH